MSAPTAQRQRLHGGAPLAPAAEPRGRAVRARRGAAVGHGAAGADHRRAAEPGRLLPGEPRRGSTRRCSTCTTQGEPVDALTLVEHLKQAGELDERRRRRPRSSCSPARVPAVGNLRQYARIVKRERDAAPAAARGLRDPGAGPQPRGAAARARRHGRALDPRGRPRGLAQGLPLDRAAAGRRARQAAEALARGQPDHRHAVRASRTWTRSPAASSPAT